MSMHATNIETNLSSNQMITNLLESEYPNHPFGSIPESANYEFIMANYLAMSQAFPYLQAGSQKDIFWTFMENNEDVPEHVELTTIVGNFLCWDETGGLYPTMALKLKALPKLLETERFHSNILKQDCIKIFGKQIQPNYSKVTKTYLKNLYDLLSSKLAIVRLAAMVSFEHHANQMITALWNSLSNHFKDIQKDSLTYFRLHVGEHNPAEIHHVEMTNRLVDKIVKENDFDIFINNFRNSYSLHQSWCSDVVCH